MLQLPLTPCLVDVLASYTHLIRLFCSIYFFKTVIVPVDAVVCPAEINEIRIEHSFSKISAVGNKLYIRTIYSSHIFSHWWTPSGLAN